MKFGYLAAVALLIIAGGLVSAQYHPNPKPPLREAERDIIDFQRRSDRQWQGQNQPRNSPGTQQTGGGPWMNDLMIQRGNGSRFEAESSLVPAAGVPSAIRTEDGRIIVAFQWFPQEEKDKAYWDKVAVIISHDTGRTWSDPLPITVNGLPEGFQRPFDPTLVELSDGRIRIFFSSGARPQGGKPDGGIGAHIAISQNGILFEYETGPVLASGTKYPVIDPAVASINGLWHYTAPVSEPGSPHEKPAFHAVSTDGLHFTRAEQIPAQGENWTGNLIPWKDGIRFYGGGRNGIWWSYSKDGSDWTKPHSTSIRGGDPSVVETGEGDFYLIYVGAGKGESDRKRQPVK